MSTASSFVPHSRYTYTKVSDGMGGYTKVLSAPLLLYGAAELWEAQVTLLTNRQESLVPEDIVSLNDAYNPDLTGNFEVKSIMSMGTGPFKRAILEKVDRPIFPIEAVEE